MDTKQTEPGGTDHSSWKDKQSGTDKKASTGKQAAPDIQADDLEDEADKQLGNPRSDTEDDDEKHRSNGV